MKLNNFIIISMGAASWLSAGVVSAFAEPTSCRAKYHTTSQMSGEAPGSLSTSKDTPCRLSRNIGGVARGAPSGVAGGFAVIEKPKNGDIMIENRSSLIFTPHKGFAGNDTMLIKMKYKNGSGGLVRFSISVD